MVVVVVVVVTVIAIVDGLVEADDLVDGEEGVPDDGEFGGEDSG